MVNQDGFLVFASNQDAITIAFKGTLISSGKPAG